MFLYFIAHICLMAQIKPDDRRFRQKHEMAEDMAKVLNSDLTIGTKYAVLLEIAWVWTEFSGKHKGCPFWSLEALELKDLPSKQIESQTIHEHLVPRKVVFDKVFELPLPVTPLQVFAIFDAMLVGVVVTKAENQALTNVGLRNSMPACYFDHLHPDFCNPWSRYKQPDAVIHVARVTPDMIRPPSRMPLATIPSWLVGWVPPARIRQVSTGCSCVTCSS